MNPVVHDRSLFLAIVLTLVLNVTSLALTEGDYTYTVANNVATITDFNSLCSGELSITNTLGGYQVASIGGWAFNGVIGLTGITIPASVTNVGSWAFSQCMNLTSVTIPDSVIGIGEDAFSFCTNLTSFSVATASSAYSSTNGVLFNKSRTFLVQYPSAKAGSSYSIPDTVISIRERAFQCCSSLTSVTIPASVTNIGMEAFGAMTSRTSLVSIDVDAMNPAYCSEDGVLFDKSKTTLIRCPGSKTGDYTIPNGVTNLLDESFEACFDLNRVTIPDSVTSLGGGAFVRCISLTSIVIPNSVTSIGHGAFYCCYSLSSVYFRGNAPTLGYNVFGADTNTVYYLLGRTGFGSTFGDRPTMCPKMLGTSTLGISTNLLSFNIACSNDITVLVEARTNLASGSWRPASTNTLSGGSSCFSDANWTNYPTRFYRLNFP